MARPPERSPAPERVGLWIEDVSRSLNANLTVSENLAQCWVVLTVVEGQGYPIQPLPALKGKAAYGLSVERVQIISGGIVEPVWAHWEPTLLNGKPALKLLSVFGLAPGSKVTLTLLVKAE